MAETGFRRRRGRSRGLAAALVLALAAWGVAAGAADEPPAPRFIDGGGGLPIALWEWGDPAGPGVLLLHGFGFGAEFWLPQAGDEKLAGLHLVAIDLRGHGASGKPWRPEDLVDTRLWAEDVAAAIAAAGLERPVIVGWSYGGYVAMDYVRHFGADSLAGLVLVSSPAGLADRVQPKPDEVPGGPEAFARSARQRDSLSTLENLEGSRYLARIMSASPLPDEIYARWTAMLMRLPVYTSHAMRGRSLDNRDLQPALTLPVAFAVGDRDHTMPAARLEALADELPQGEYWRFPGSGHAVPTEAETDFDARLLAFVTRTMGSE